MKAEQKRMEIAEIRETKLYAGALSLRQVLNSSKDHKAIEEAKARLRTIRMTNMEIESQAFMDVPRPNQYAEEIRAHIFGCAPPPPK